MMGKKAMIQRFTAVATKSVAKEEPKMTPAQKRAADLKRIKNHEEAVRSEQIKKDLNTARYYAFKMNNAQERNIPFRLTLLEMKELTEATHCAYTGQKFPTTGEDIRTLERINPKEGYIPGNCVMVTEAANKHKAKLDAFMHLEVIPAEMKLKLLRKAVYQMEKELKSKK